ncbi:MAG: DUF4893 domain-containing protein [Sphingomonadales bacterium]|jgi:hypothetical protein
MIRRLALAPRLAVLVLPLLLAACSTGDELRPYAFVRRADVWQAVITDADRSRLSRTAAAWRQAGADVSGAGADAALAALGPAGQSETRAPPLFPAAGSFQCRTILLGWRQGEPQITPPVQAGAWAPCKLAADGILFRFETAPGPQQYLGTLYPDVDRLVFLGTVRLAGEMGRLRYGADHARDQVGVLQAIAPSHWRIALPWPQWTARLVLIEIRVPA